MTAITLTGGPRSGDTIDVGEPWPRTYLRVGDGAGGHATYLVDDPDAPDVEATYAAPADADTSDSVLSNVGPRGPEGPMGPAGMMGPTGPQGPDGEGLVPRGEWDESVVYDELDMVHKGIGSWVSLSVGNIDNDPEDIDPDPVWWLIVAMDGEDGPPGPAGPAGPSGDVGTGGGLNWRGPYNGTDTYEEDDLVSYAGALWRAPETISGAAPSTVAGSAVIGVSRGVTVRQSDRPSAVDRDYLITAASDANDISGRNGRVVYVTAGGSGATIRLTNTTGQSAHWIPFFGVGSSWYGIQGDWSSGSVDVPINPGDTAAIHLYFNSPGVYGTIQARVVSGSATPPPVAWDFLSGPSMGDWQAVSFASGWSNYGSVFPTVAYRKDSNGFVHLRGTMTGTIGTTAFTLPAGFRPDYLTSGQQAIFIAPSGGTGIVVIMADGQVQPQVGSNAYTGLDGISFYAG